jgi:hypothetical protein
MTTPPTTDQGEEFFETLSGLNERHAGAKVMRDAVLDELETTSEADAASEETLTDDERAAARNVKARMMHDGNWPMAHPSQAAPVKPTNDTTRAGPLGAIAQWLGIRMHAGAWQGALGLAAVVVLGSVIVFKGLMPQTVDVPSDPTVVRGEQGPIVYVENPHQAAAAMAEKLNALGAEATTVPINDRKAIVDVVVPAGVDSARLHAELTRSGFNVERSNMYRLAFSAAIPRP